jgi:hypothetical protein
MRGRFHAAKIVDFSRAAVSCAKGTVRGAPPSSSSSASSSERALLLSSTIRTEDVPVFLDDMETCLPCVTSRLALKRTYETYMIYADGFVGANLNVRLQLYYLGWIYGRRPQYAYLGPFLT